MTRDEGENPIIDVGHCAACGAQRRVMIRIDTQGTTTVALRCACGQAQEERFDIPRGVMYTLSLGSERRDGDAGDDQGDIPQGEQTGR